MKIYLSLQEIECERRRRDAETRDEVCQVEHIISFTLLSAVDVNMHII